jgi:hypothetical protein
MKNAAVAFLIATTLLISPPVEARDRVSAGLVVSSTTAGLMASAQRYSPEYRGELYLAVAPAIFGYGYRATYYGNGFNYQPAYYSPHALCRTTIPARATLENSPSAGLG